ncbi:histidine--tRNA ligase, cytoplasmic-like [Cucurbita pepo subsp. pepo]|uniref:histidine--tRNA ligase, cytoplasmic-like n=1 Tax=Cucurbita pepo subsp. pepo TaxID=3664 RepID=UPI000C9D8032|nr:histidine--tRNA ligase, cytoplasmic-like [Cucurbita pepo subsp. pepo]
MADPAEVSVITLGGKGSSLSSSSIHAIAHGFALVRIDSSALERLASSSNNRNAASVKHQVVIPDYLTSEEARASLVVLLNKLIISSSSGIRSVIPVLIAETLNSNPETLQFESLDVTDEELSVFKQSCYVLNGVCALLDHQSAALSSIADAVASISCEASRADVSVFNLMDSGDGFASKEEVGVANDMKVLLNGSKLVGKIESGAISKIPKNHGCLREQAKLVHSKMRVELNSNVKIGKGGSLSSGTEDTVRTALLSFAAMLWDLGKCSLDRGKLILDSNSDDNMKASLAGLLDRECPSNESLKKVYRLVSDLALDDNYDEFVHTVNVLLLTVWKIVVWEAIAGFLTIEGGKLIGKGQDVDMNRANEKGVNKSEKKKKAVLGKGTSVVVQLIKDRLQGKGGDLGLENSVKDLLSFLDPKASEFDNLLMKIREIVESNESRRLPKLPKGTRDFAKEQMAIRKKAFSIIEGVFERHGATALDTPAFELRETLMGKYGEDSKLIYDLSDQGGELCSLRYDLTVPFARYVAMNGITSFKRYQIAKVYRRDNPSKGRFREFYQCDFDIAGQYEKMGPDFEVIKILTELLDELNIGQYEIKLNHRKLLDGMLEICGVPPEKFRTICSSIDKLDKQSFDQIKREMVEEKGLALEIAERIGDFVKERGHPLELLAKLKQEQSPLLQNKGSSGALSELEILFRALEKAKCVDKVVFDLSLARGLDYYTGVIYEAIFKGGTQVGSIAAGGRYDNLIGMFGSKQVPAVGVSLGIERVFVIMEQLLKDQNQTTRATKTEILVSILGDDLTQAAELASEIWSAKLNAEFLINKRVMKHIDRAKESRIPWIVFLGEREVSEGIVKLKNVETFEEVTILRSNIIDELKKRLAP